MAEANPTPLKGKLPDLLIEDDRSENQYPYKSLERSQSEAALLQHRPVPKAGSISSQDSADGLDQINISECSKVYFDLSKGETFEEHTKSNALFAVSKSSSKRFLETIHQNEELRVDNMSLDYRGQRLSVGSTSSVDSQDGKVFRITEADPETRSSYESVQFQTNLDSLSISLREKIATLVKSGHEVDQVTILHEVSMLIEQAWAMPAIGRDLAYSLSAIFHQEKGLDIVLKNCMSDSKDLLLASVRVLEQVLTTNNREYIATTRLEPLLTMCVKFKEDRDLCQIITSILESMFKTSEETCNRLIELGGLGVILYWCRSKDRLTLRHCAIALANLALYGGPENHGIMVNNKVPEWLFPLAFNKDDIVRYYACLAISVLVANKYDKKIEAAVLNSGTLELVLPFISSHTPMEFAQMDLWHRHGRSLDWLNRLVPILTSKRKEPQALAAFHFAMEAGIKSEQGRKKIFHEIDAVEPLKKVASTSPNPTASRLAAEALKILGEEIPHRLSQKLPLQSIFHDIDAVEPLKKVASTSPNPTASSLASEALKILGEEIPHRLSQNVPLWSVEDVIFWVSQIGFANKVPFFKQCLVDGDLLLRITEEDLLDSIRLESSLSRKRFMRELRELKMSSDYSSCDPTKLDHWLKDLSPDLGQYTYQLLQNGVDKPFLSQICEEHLRLDCGVHNGVHRAKILQQIRNNSSQDTTDGVPDTHREDKIDAFISYRRINGAQLASLLKVHLQLRGFSVFLDIERLNAGKFDEGLLTSIAQSKNFVLILTQDALERCKGDMGRKDWVHREIVAALESKCNIIPIIENFEWPSSDQLPEDMRQISFFNGIKWIHDYQDACVDKLERFLRGEKKSTLQGLGSSFDEDRNDQGCRPKRSNLQNLGASFEDCL